MYLLVIAVYRSPLLDLWNNIIQPRWFLLNILTGSSILNEYADLPEVFNDYYSRPIQAFIMINCSEFFVHHMIPWECDSMGVMNCKYIYKEH